MGLCLFGLVDGPWYSLDNLFASYCVYIAIVAVIATLWIFVSVARGGLGPVIGSFFNGGGGADVPAASAIGSAPPVAANAKEPLAETPTATAFTATKACASVAAKDRGNATSFDDEDMLYLQQLLKRHSANDSHAWIALAQTAVYGLCALFLLHYCPAFLSVLLMAAAQVRAFIVFHDACHMSFFTSSKKNVMLAKVLEAMVCTRAEDWTRSHNHHHQHLGNCEVPDFSLTVWFSEKEYSQMRPDLRFAYRLVRDPMILPALLCLFVFWVTPIARHPMKTLVTRGYFYVPLFALFGAQTALLTALASFVAGIIGIELFHLQHQCNTPYRVRGEAHSKWDAGMLGSTHLLVWWPLTLMTNGIEFHHIHHASTLVPSYHLAACHREGEEYDRAKTARSTEIKFEGSGSSKAGGADTEGEGFWGRAGVNRVGLKKAFLSHFHTLFEGDVKHSHNHRHGHADGAGSDGDGSRTEELLRFRSFDVYRWLGLEDTEFGIFNRLF